MMVMTAKLNFKKIMMMIAAAAAVVLALILLMGGGKAEESSAPAVSGNQARVDFLRDMGWEVETDPTESSRVKMPQETSAVYERYNNLQKSQGYDLSSYAGKKAMRYVYQVKNYPGATAPVYATLLVCQDKIIGGDITDTAAGGKIRGLKRVGKTGKQSASLPAETTQPAQDATVETHPMEAPQ